MIELSCTDINFVLTLLLGFEGNLCLITDQLDLERQYGERL